MELKKLLATLTMLLLVLFISNGVIMETEAGICEKPSKYFKGPCGGDGPCTTACRRERWPRGQCKSFLGACTCVRHFESKIQDMELKKFLGAIMMLLLLPFISNGVAMETEDGICSKPAKYFKGPCILRLTCGLACGREGYPIGKCTHFLGRCICYKPCRT